MTDDSFKGNPLRAWQKSIVPHEAIPIAALINRSSQSIFYRNEKIRNFTTLFTEYGQRLEKNEHFTWAKETFHRVFRNPGFEFPPLVKTRFSWNIGWRVLWFGRRSKKESERLTDESSLRQLWCHEHSTLAPGYEWNLSLQCLWAL